MLSDWPNTSAERSGVRHRADTPAVSIILPTYNRTELLRESVASVLAQTFGDWELIAADDGSDQETLDFLETLAEDTRVRILRLPHSGNPGKARNAGIALARAPVVAFLDSDDLWASDFLELQLEQLRTESRCAWSYTAFTIVDLDNVPLSSEWNRQWIPHRGWIFEQIIRTTASIRVPAVVVYMRLLRDAGGFDEAIDCGEDYDLWARLALLSPISVVDRPLVRIRRHTQNHSGTVGRGYFARDYSLRKLSRQLEGAECTLLQEERSSNAARLAALLAANGNHRSALSVIAWGFPFSWKYPRWWYRVAKTLVRVCVGLVGAKAQFQPYPH